MKLLTRCLLVVMLLAAATASAVPWGNPLLYHNDFDAAAYVVGQTVVGTDAWVLHATETGGGGSDTTIQQETGHGKLLKSYRASGGGVHHVYRDLGPGASSGVASVSFDGKRVDVRNNTTWFYVDDGTDILAYYGMTTDPGHGDVMHVYTGSSLAVPAISHNEWYRVGADMRFTGAGAGTFDIVAYRPDGTVAAARNDIPFYSAAATAQNLHVRTYGTGSGARVDNLRLERPVDRMRHGDLDRLQTGNLAPQAGWTMGAGSASVAQVAPDTWTGTGNVARVTPAGWKSLHQDLLDVALPPGPIRYSVDARWDGPSHSDSWAWFAVGDNTMTLNNPSNPASFMGSAPSFGLRSHSSGPDHEFFAMDGVGTGAPWGTFEYSTGSEGFADDTWYTFQADLHTTGSQANTWDLTVYDRDTGRKVWTKHGLGFNKDGVDLSRVGIYARESTGTMTFDNQSVTAKPTTPTLAPWANQVLYENNFQAPDYVIGQNIAGTDGWVQAPDSGTPVSSRSIVEEAAGHGKVLDNNRVDGVHHVYRSLDTVKDTGRATFSFDAKRYGSASDHSWLYIDDDAGNTLAYLGMNNGSGTFTVYDGAYHSFGSLGNNQWYQIAVDMRMTGPGAGTYDIVARGPDGALAGEWLGQPFNDAGATPGRFHVRTYGVGTGCQVDNLRLEEGTILNKIMHGDFDRLAPGTAPDDGAPVGGWATGDGAYAEGGDTSRVAIAVKPGLDPTDLALHVTKSGAGSDPASVQQVFAKPYTQGAHKLIVQLDQLTSEGLCGAEFGVANGSGVASFALVGLRDEGSPEAGNPYGIRTWSHTGAVNMATWTPGMTYTLRTSVDLETDTLDVYVRGGEYERWTQIGKQLPFGTSGDIQQADRLLIGQYYRACDAYVDNVVAVDSSQLPVTIHYQNRFETCVAGERLDDQNDGWVGDGIPGFENNSGSRGWVVHDPVMGNVAAVTATTAGSGYTSFAKDLDVICESGTAVFSVDARWDRTPQTGGSDYAYFALGDSDVLIGGSGYSPSAAIFGFRQGKFMIRPGDGSGGFGILLSAANADTDTWYRLVAAMHLTGEARNTWDFQVYNRDTGALLWDYAGVPFATDYTDLTRLGLFVYDRGGSPSGTLYFDNLDLRDIPEPATMLLLAGGLLALARRRKRR